MSRVLVLEDNDNLASSIVRALEATGHQAMRFRSLHEARATIPPIGFDVLLCDYELADGNGIDFLADVDRYSQSMGGLSHWLSILWSGLDRTDEVKASGLAIDHVRLKNDIGGLLDLIGETA